MRVFTQVFAKYFETISFDLGFVDEFLDAFRMFVRRWGERNRLTVDRKYSVPNEDRLAGKSDHALNIVDLRVPWTLKHDDIAPFGEIPMEEDHWLAEIFGEGKIKSVGKLIYKDVIAYLDRWNHRTRRDFVRLEKTRAHKKYEKECRNDRDEVFE